MKSYGGGPGSGIGQMDLPCYLAIDRNDVIRVVDFNNNRIIQLNVLLEFIRESAGLKKPTRMYLHEQTRSLYVADFGEDYITILDL